MSLPAPALSVVIPVFNEQQNIQFLYEKLTAVVAQMGISYEFIFVNDGSRDSSLLLIKGLAATYPEVKYISLSRNFGHQVAVSAGLDKAYGQAVLIIDADLQDPPELVPAMYAKLQEGHEVVYARRRKRGGDSFMKKLTAKLFYRLLHKITHVSIPVDTGDFRIMDQKVVQVLRQMPEQDKFLRGQIAWIGFKQGYVEFDRGKRHHGTTGYTYRKMVRLALDAITSFSDFPLRMASMLGFVVSGLAFLLMLYSLFARLVLKNYVEGWASIMLSVLFLGGIQLICLGIIGEYLARIFNNVRSRPLYVEDESNIGKPQEP